jgi:hypothetical protein
MQIIKRRDAKILGLSKYFTGKPCAKGHLAERYIASGGCSECLADAGRAKRGAEHPRVNTKLAKLNEDARERYLKKQTALGELVQTRELIHEKDVATINDLAKGLCLARYPILEMDDIPNIRPVSGKLYSVYFVLVPLEHVEMMRKTCKTVWLQTPADFSRSRQELELSIAKQNAGEGDWPSGRM